MVRPNSPAANHDGVLEQSALFEVAHEGGGGLVHVLALLANLGGEAAVLVPSAMKELDEGHAAFGEPAGDEAVVGETFPHGVLAVEVEHVLGFVLQVDQFGHAGLHAVGHLVLGDAGVDFGVAGLLLLGLVDFGDSVEHGTAHVARDAFGVGEVKHGIPGAAELDPLVLGGKDPLPPEAVV